ncbi:DUF742 domain-containing protein [Streptomyces sp. 5.8]|uniref:DUF742 domain-containing protein n=1 Tax=Streptomyces sp. 5.8 TaxID=3406571 RepID=UPI003BB75CDB
MPQSPTDPVRPPAPPPPAPAPIAPRPYTITAGRTVTRLSLPLEALVQTMPSLWPGTGHPEHDRILELCVRPTSVAEVSARLPVPVGVARVLLSDLSGMGLVSVTEPSGDEPSTALIERVLSGLHSI